MPVPELWPTGPQRPPVVAGRFYPGDARELKAQVRDFLRRAGEGSGEGGKGDTPTLLVMAPHAGYMYSGAVAGATLGRAKLSPSLLLLGPNHTGRGAALSLWGGGRWLIPGGSVDIDGDLALALVRNVPSLTLDMAAHAHEHSLEVLLPFVCELSPAARMVPVAVAEPRLDRLLAAAKGVAALLKARPGSTTIIVSSDMSHYLPHEQAKEQDRLALDRVEALDPEGLYATVRSRGITMCGMLPMTLGLAVCRELGATRAQVVAYATSGDAGGDYRRVVGYAGVLVS